MTKEFPSFAEWQKRFPDESACEEYLIAWRWPNGFVCPKCGHDKGYRLAGRKVFECGACGHQASARAGTMFHSTKLSLSKWFWALYWITSNQGEVSSLRLAKMIDVHWRTARSMLRKLKTTMAQDHSLQQLAGLVTKKFESGE
jgi:transposase-like protein